VKKNMRTKCSLASLAVFATLIPLSLHGEVRTFVAERTVNRIDDPLGTLTFAYIGAAFKFKFSFDSDAPDLNETASLGIYDGIAALTTIGGGIFSSGPPRIEIQHPRDFLNAGAEFTYPGSQRAGAGLRLGLGDSDTSLTDVLLPAVPYSLDLCSYKSLGATFQYPDPNSSSPFTALILASLDSFYAVPEPSMLGLVSTRVLLVLTNRDHQAHWRAV
jgi:hypothetical protein